MDNILATIRRKLMITDADERMLNACKMLEGVMGQLEKERKATQGLLEALEKCRHWAYPLKISSSNEEVLAAIKTIEYTVAEAIKAYKESTSC